MALRRFRGASSTSTVVFTGQAFVSRELLDTGSASGSNGSSVTLAAGASASFYLISPTGSPNLTTSVTGSWEASLMFQSVTPTNIFCKFRVHRISVAGTVPTILASTEYSAEVQARRTNTPYIISTDATDLGTFSSGHRIAVEWTIRNAGGASISPQPSFGTYSRFVRTPIESTTAVGWTALDRSFAGYRPVSYSEGTINGVKRTGFVRNSITSSGTATGTQGGQDYSGSVTGVSTSTGTVTGAASFAGSVTGTSTSTGTIAAGRQGYAGAATGTSSSSGTISAGIQGYTGTATGSSVSSGTIGAGVQGYSGAASGSSTSTGSANGTPGPGPEPGTNPEGSAWRLWNQDFEEKAREPLALIGKTSSGATYSFATIKGWTGFSGGVLGVSVERGSSWGRVGYYGQTRNLRLLLQHRARGKARPDLRESRELLLIGEL